MSATQAPEPVALADMIAEIEREIRLRRAVYPHWVRDGRLKQAAADIQMRRLQAAADRLKELGHV